MLLWTDRTTGLAHCYESDKSQPGKPWYRRSLAFHDWISAALGTTPAKLADETDWLFKRVIEDLAAGIETQRSRRLFVAREQRASYEGRGFPLPGDNPELTSLIREELAPYLEEQPPGDVWRLITERVQSYLGLENKRKNLVGEGFEDVLAAVISRLATTTPLSAATRTILGELPGFHPQRASEKEKRVDLAVVNQLSGHRTLVTAKWSIRADREEQFLTDYNVYERSEAAGEDFDYVLVTNEFDPARLLAACDNRRGNKQLLFTTVVHVNPEGVLAAYGPRPQRSAQEVAARIQQGRLASLAGWLAQLA